MNFESKLSQGYIPALDFIRAIAVFLVILYHFGFKINGALGVEMFFVLSGFLITWLLIRENEKTGDVSFSGFYKRRSLRIFPAFYAYVIFALGIAYFRGKDLHLTSALSSVLYLENYHAAIFKPGDTAFSHAWSLAIEEQFYLLFPLLFWRLRDNLPRMAKVLLGIILGVWVHRAILWFGFGVYQGYIYHAFDTRADHLLIGCLMAVLAKLGVMDNLKPLAVRWYFPLITMTALGMSAACHSSNDYRFSVGYALEPILVALLIYQLITMESWRGVTENPLVRYLGRISYPLYLYQQLTLFTARRLTAEYPVYVQFVFAVAVTVGFATASYYLIEQPFLKLKSRHK